MDSKVSNTCDLYRLFLILKIKLFQIITVISTFLRKSIKHLLVIFYILISTGCSKISQHSLNQFF